jgi:hypothetical protein
VVRLRREELLQERPGLEPLGVRLVRRHLRDGRLVERQGVEDRRLGVVGVRPVDLLHGLLVGDDPGPLAGRREVAIQLADRGHVRALAIGRRADRLGFLDRGRAALERVGRPDAAERVPPLRHRDPPPHHGAAGILREHSMEPVDGGAEPERVKERHRAIEVRLRRGVARGREVDGPDPRGIGRTVLMQILCP